VEELSHFAGEFGEGALSGYNQVLRRLKVIDVIRKVCVDGRTGNLGENPGDPEASNNRIDIGLFGLRLSR
jgi:hypothetical protein